MCFIFFFGPANPALEGIRIFLRFSCARFKILNKCDVYITKIVRRMQNCQACCVELFVVYTDLRIDQVLCG